MSEEKDVITIKLPKFTKAARENPWMISTFALGFFVVIILTNSIFFSDSSISGNAVSEKIAADNLMSFLESQGTSVSLISTEKESGLYKVTVDFQGQNVPVYVTQDGGYFIQDLIPLDSTGNNIPTTTAGTRNQLSADDDAVLGDANAPVEIIEFSDYQCPFCRQFWTETLPLLKQNYIDTGKAKLVYRDYPIPSLGHALAVELAESAECAREVGGSDEAYYEMHDKIFEEQNILDGGSKTGAVTRTVSEFTVSDIKRWAKEIGYNIDSCMDSGKYTNEVMKDLSEGGSLGTPTFFINGQEISGAQPYSVFEQIIEAELARI
jgi:protein-disulfide isomerase